MKPYPKYKPSGIGWLSEVPEHWKIERIKTLIDSAVNGIWGEDATGDENDIVCVRVADFDMDRLCTAKDNLTFRNISPENSDGKVLDHDHLLIEKSGGGELQPVGRVIRFNLSQKAVSSNFVSRLAVNTTKAIPDFILFYFHNLYSKRINTRSIKQTTGIQNLDLDSYLNEIIAVAPLDEQRAISNYLYDKTYKIDTLIEKKQRLIELLKEQRIAIINQAVTKGIKPNVKMKDSGIEWIGEIPEHWEVKKLKYVAQSVQTGKTPPSERLEYFDEGDVDWFTPVDFNDSLLLIDSKRKITTRAIQDQVVKLFEPNSVLIVGIGATLGKSGIIDKPSSANQQINAIAFTESYSPLFGLYFLKAMEPIIVSLSNASTLAILNQDDTKSLTVLNLPRYEQDEIVRFIVQEVERVHKVVLRTEKEIEMLQEYRTALISEVVTGKIDVRKYACKIE